ncbi:DUF3592 domain-containing protein [Streptomyces diastaticus]|uniref:DUF3592 domain-containing protein n=1 Tax=Streptomyces diastaticus TaxID=1956 RepID=UPI0036CD2748
MVDKKKRRRRDDWTPPPKSAARLAAERDMRQFKALQSLPPVPQRRVILVGYGMALLLFAMFLGFLLPSLWVVEDLRSRGVPVAAEVLDTSNNKYGDVSKVEVRFEGPDGAVETELHDVAGKYPEGLFPGAVVDVTYDPRAPGRALTTGWVENPPMVSSPLLVTGALTPPVLGLAVFITIRRRRLLKERKRITAS